MKRFLLYTMLLGLCPLLLTAQAPDTLWTKTYGGTGFDDGYSVQETSDGGYIVAGNTESFGAGGCDIYLIKTEADGDTMWTKTYGEGGDYDWLISVQPTSDSGYIVAGFTDSQGAGSADVWLIKTDSNGDTLWTKTYGGDAADYGYSVQQTSDGGYIVAGSTESAGSGNGDAWLIKTAPDTFGIAEYQNTKSKILRLDVSPNPFSHKIFIRLQIPSEAESRFQTLNGKLQIDNYYLKIYTATGRLVRHFNLQSKICNLKSVVSWSGTDDANRKLPSGVYFLEFTAGDYSDREKLLLIR